MEENDIHDATLTVKQTLMFALRTRTPKLRPDGMSKSEYRHTFLNALLTLFGIKHTINTRVGNEVINSRSTNHIAHSWHIRRRKEKALNCRNDGDSWCGWLLG